MTVIAQAVDEEPKPGLLHTLLDRHFIKNPKLRRFVTRLMEGDKPVPLTLLGAPLTVNSIKEHGYLRASRISERGSFFRDEAPVLVTLAAVLADCDGFVDVGANIGVFSGILSRLRSMRPEMPFVAFEAHPGTAERLRANVVPLGVIVHQVAVSDSDGELEFTEGAVSHVFTGKPNAYSIAGAVVRVQSRRLDGVGLQGQRLMMKIDVEGFELEALNGASGLFDAGRIRAVYVDCYDDDAIRRFLLDRGFDLYDAVTFKPSEKPQHLLAIRPSA